VHVKSQSENTIKHCVLADADQKISRPKLQHFLCKNAVNSTISALCLKHADSRDLLDQFLQ